ncbi:hypothetical protein SRABI106_04635 [Rahnella aquatilis]|nr:hypothetical protein SRABI106_04635 [Rahnella aquatilis]
MDHFIDIKERGQQTFEDMQAFQHFIKAEVQTTAYGIAAVSQPLRQDLKQPFDLRTMIKTDHVHVNAVAAFQIGSRKQVIHHLIQIDTVGARHDDQAGRVLMI